jgi:FkbM family methyltransferase
MICYILFALLASVIPVLAVYPEYQEYPDQEIKGDGVYLSFASKINKDDIKTIFEIGSRDAKDAIELSQFFRCHVFAFECNPVAIQICRDNVRDNPNITVVPLGIWNTTGELPFYRVIHGNIGASSFFRFNPGARNYPDIVREGLIQREVKVPTIRLDEFLKSQNIDNIDLLCMDVQGAAFQVLESLGEELSKVKYIIVELEVHPVYAGEVLYQDIDNYLLQKGFERKSNPLNEKELFGDVLYAHSSVIHF